MSLTLKKVDRPRELKWYQASSMLYGDWGTSKAYVLGIAFALAGHASFYLLLAMAVLTTVVGFCYVIICKAYPDGGGVYSSVRDRSRILSVVGALLLVADYVITAALSSIEAFHYLGFEHPQFYAIGALVVIGLLNVVGPTKSSTVATWIATAVIISLFVLCAACLPHLPSVHLEPLKGPFLHDWSIFVGIVLALSGVEAIANVTGIMVEPVEKTARRAILPVLLEVTVVSLILGAVMNGIPGVENRTEDMIRAIAEYTIGPWYGKVIAVVMGLLLLSACNTAIMGLISVLFLMSKDKELPSAFSSLNRFGMPWFGLLIGVAAPILVLMFEHSVTHLAALYAIGVVGAITINFSACCTNKKISLKISERTMLGIAAVIMIFVELTIMYQKRNALIFACIVLAVGLSARYLAKRFEKAKEIIEPKVLGVNVLSLSEAKDLAPLYTGSTLVAFRAPSSNLIDEAVLHVKGKGDGVVYALYIDEKPVGWAYPAEAEPSMGAVNTLKTVVDEFEKKGVTALPIWNLAERPGVQIVQAANTLNASTVMVGATKRTAFEKMMKGEVLQDILSKLPQNKHLVICN